MNTRNFFRRLPELFQMAYQGDLVALAVVGGLLFLVLLLAAAFIYNYFWFDPPNKPKK